MRVGVIASAILHVTVLLLVLFGVPFFTEDTLDSNVVPVDIVPEAKLADVTTAKPEPEPEPDPEETPTETPPPKPKPAPPPAPAQNSVPPLAQVETDAEARETVEPEPEPEPRPTRNISPRSKPTPPSRFDAGRIAALLDKSEEPEPQEPRPEFDTEEISKKLGQSPIETQRQLVRLQDVMRAQIERCWNVPAGAENAQDLVIVLRVQLSPQGSLLSAPEIVNAERMNGPGGNYFRIAAESARRAVQRCSPLKLPPESYEIWRTVELTFDPSEMLTE